MSSRLYRLGCYAAARPWRVIGLWVLAALIIIGSSASFGRELRETFEVPGLDSQIAVDLLSAAESDAAGTTARVVVTPNNGTSFFDAGADGAVQALSDIQTALNELPDVIATSDPASALRDSREAALQSGVSSDGRVALISVQYPVVEDITSQSLEDLKATVETARLSSPLQIEMGGDLFFSFEEPETGLGEQIGLAAAAIILLLAFGSLIAMGLPIGMAVFGLALGVSMMSLVTYLIEIPAWAPQIGAMIGLGVGIDYALFLVTRHREFLNDGLPVVEAAGRAVATAGQAVLFAGGTVVIAILGLGVAGVPFMTAAGVAISMIVFIMVVASLTLLPAFLGLAGHNIDRFAIHRKTGRAAERRAGTNSEDVWTRWGTHVARHARPYTVCVTLFLLLLTAPILALDLGFPDEGTQPETQTQRRAYDLVADGFGAGSNGPLLVVVDISQDAAIIEPLQQAIAADPGIAGVMDPDIDNEAGVATLVVFATTAPQDNVTVDTVERLRSDVFPPVLQDSPATAHVGGQTASFSDVAQRVKDRLPAFIAAVIVLSFLLLMVLFRSVLVPLKAALLNLLSIGAAYGVLVMVFQWGWAKELFGLESTVPIVSFIPMFLFAMLFGLSMDYEVFLLSRIREEYKRTGDNNGSVIHGIASTARVITSAALIMICVFGGFVLSDDPVTKMFGLGLATAIFVDVTIVRLILVPASMSLLGDANWWLPNWLDRFLPNVDLEG